MNARQSRTRYRRHWGISPRTRYQLGQCAALAAAIRAAPLPPETGRRLVDEALARGALATTGMEGSAPDEHDVARAMAGRSLPAERAAHAREVTNVIQATLALLDEVAAGEISTVDAGLLRHVHAMVGDGLRGRLAATPGRFRTGSARGPYTAPRADEVAGLVDGVFAWLHREFSGGTGEFGRAVVRAVVTHVYVLWIRPFGDGNGRTARLLETCVLAAAGNPAIASHLLTEFYAATRDEYLRQLELASRDRSLTSFIAYAVEGFRDRLRETLQTVTGAQFDAAWRSHVRNRFSARDYRKKSVFRRRRDLILAIPIDGTFTTADLARLDPDLSHRYAGLSARTLRRDLTVLIDEGLLVESAGAYRPNTDALRTTALPPAAGTTALPPTMP